MPDIMTPAQQFKTPADALAHYGVKGMKWGVTQADVNKAPTKADISDARLRVAGKNVKYHQQRAKIKRSDVAKSDKKEALADLKVKTLSDPDRMTAMRMTKGEKAVFAVLALGAAPVAANIAVSRASVGRQLNKAQAEQARRDRKR